MALYKNVTALAFSTGGLLPDLLLKKATENISVWARNI
jgi:hypothetical protein